MRPGHRILDLACGKGELLATWAAAHGSAGVGVDLSEVFLTAARERAEALGVAGRLRFVHREAAGYLKAEEPRDYDIVSCLGATWIGGGLSGTITIMRPALSPDGILLVGEPFWMTEPPAAAYQDLGLAPDEFTTLAGTAQRLAEAGLELLEMVLADQDSWDRYVASQWWTISDWLRRHPEHPDAGAMREFLASSRDAHLAYQRDCLGWGVFVTRPARPAGG